MYESVKGQRILGGGERGDGESGELKTQKYVLIVPTVGSKRIISIIFCLKNISGKKFDRTTETIITAIYPPTPIMNFSFV